MLVGFAAKFSRVLPITRIVLYERKITFTVQQNSVASVLENLPFLRNRNTTLTEGGRMLSLSMEQEMLI